MHISVECKSPKYAAGSHEFSRFEQVFAWLAGIRGIGKSAPGYCLYGLAESGRYSAHSARYDVRMVSDVSDRSLALEVGEKAGLVSHRIGGRRTLSSREAARIFALEWDRSWARNEHADERVKGSGP